VPRAKQRTPALRDRLLQAALAALARDGIAGLTTRAVARDAATSAPAVYELFGDKTGLVRELFFEGFRLLRRRFDPLVPTADARADVARVVQTFRAFVRDNPMLAALMFSRPFAAFDPGPVEEEAGSAVRLYIVAQVQRAIDAGVLAGDATDVAHVLVSMAQGLAATERAGWLGRSQASIDRRWEVAIRAVLDGLRPGRASGARAPRRR
jgi:AcrR family transcriptional regulator